MTHRVIDTLPRGATFPILKTQSGWHQIQLDDGRTAWIADSVVRLAAAAPSSLMEQQKLERLGLVMVRVDSGSFISQWVPGWRPRQRLGFPSVPHAYPLNPYLFTWGLRR